MSTVNQIYTIMNSLNAQANQGHSLEVVDTRSFISYGETISSLSTANKETWFKTLIDRIASTIIDNRDYTPQLASGLWREPFEYGAILSKLHAKLPSISPDPAFADPGDLSDTNPFAPTVREIEQRLYNKISAFMIADTIPDVQLDTAFLNETEMAAFFDGLMTSTDAAYNRSVENLACACRSALIATAYNEGGAHYVPLLTMFKTVIADDDPRQSWTASDYDAMLCDRDFLRYCSKQIALTIKHIQTMNTMFSAEGYERWTPRRYLNVAILDDYETSVRSYLAADTYHEELLSLPTENVTYVPYWQGASTNFGFDKTSAIEMKIPGNGDTGITVQLGNIVAAIYDSEAAGITIDQRRTRTLYNPKDEFTNYWHKGRKMYYVDATHPHVIFTLR